MIDQITYYLSINHKSFDENVEIIRSDIMIEFQKLTL